MEIIALVRRKAVSYSPGDPARASVQVNSPLLRWLALLFLGALFVFLGWLFVPPLVTGLKTPARAQSPDDRPNRARLG